MEREIYKSPRWLPGCTLSVSESNYDLSTKGHTPAWDNVLSQISLAQVLVQSHQVL